MIHTSHIQYNTPKTQDVGYYVDQMARTCLNRCLCALCHHPVPDYAHPHRQIYHRGIPLGGLPSIFCRQLARQVGGVRLIHGEPDGPQINSAFSSSISWRSMSVHDDDSLLATPAPTIADPISEPPPRSSSPITHHPLGARRQRRPDNAIRHRPDFLSKAKSCFNILLNILQSPYIAIMFL
jgi:hypothetical protein